MLIGYFDYLVIGILLFLNVKYWRTRINQNSGCILGSLLFGFLLPFVSMIIELQIVGEWMDSFEVVYTYLRFPMYWSIGIVQVIVIGIKLSRNKPKEQNEKERFNE